MASSLVEAPAVLSIYLHGRYDAPLPLSKERIFAEPEASVSNFSPVTFLAQAHLTSELLRYL